MLRLKISRCLTTRHIHRTNILNKNLTLQPTKPIHTQTLNLSTSQFSHRKPQSRPKTSKIFKTIVKSKPAQNINGWIDKQLHKRNPNLVLRKSELYYGMLESMETLSLSLKNLWNRKPLTYKQIMSLDRAKRDMSKLLLSVSPLIFIPFSFVWYFPFLFGLSYLFPRAIMPAHYMRGENSRQYYRQIHLLRKKGYTQVLHMLNTMSNTYVVPYYVDDVINQMHKGQNPDINKLAMFKDYCKREPRLHLINCQSSTVSCYCATLNLFSAMTPKAFAIRRLHKRLSEIVILDRFLRQPGELNNLSGGELREACHIRGCNGYELYRTDEANRYWLKNWIFLTKDVDENLLSSDQGLLSYVSLTMVLWSMNFSNATFLKF